MKEKKEKYKMRKGKTGKKEEDCMGREMTVRKGGGEGGGVVEKKKTEVRWRKMKIRSVSSFRVIKVENKKERHEEETIREEKRERKGD